MKHNKPTTASLLVTRARPVSHHHASLVSTRSQSSPASPARSHAPSAGRLVRRPLPAAQRLHGGHRRHGEPHRTRHRQELLGPLVGPAVVRAGPTSHHVVLLRVRHRHRLALTLLAARDRGRVREKAPRLRRESSLLVVRSVTETSARSGTAAWCRGGSAVVCNMQEGPSGSTVPRYYLTRTHDSLETTWNQVADLYQSL